MPAGGWGYPFPWTNRDARVPAGTPNAVVTAFVADALLEADAQGLRVDEGGLSDAGTFLVEALRRIPGPDASFCFSYTPLDRRAVHNANVLVAALLARLARRLDRPEWGETALTAARFTLADSLKAWVTDTLCPDLGNTLAADLLSAALGEVNWNELADQYLETFAESA